MGKGNLALRTKAVPYRAQPWSTQQYDLTDDSTTVLGTAQGNGGSIRMSLPYKGDLITANLSLQANASVTSPTELRFAIGTFDTDGITPIAPDQATIARHHAIITGRSSPFFYGSQAVVFLDQLNLAPVIPKRGDPDYNEDGFVLYVDLVAKDPTGWVLFEFKVDCISQIGVL